MKLPSYPKVYALGHRAIQTILSGDIVIEEKIDGSQFSFGSINGEFCCRSKGAELYFDNPEKMFKEGIDVAYQLFQDGKLVNNMIYRAFLMDGLREYQILRDINVLAMP